MIPLIEEKLDAIKEICRRYGVARLEVFGSAADDSFDSASSDVDFLVAFEPDQDLGPWMAHYFDLQSELEELLDCSVDLVMLTALKNPLTSFGRPTEPGDCSMQRKSPKWLEDVRASAAFILEATVGKRMESRRRGTMPCCEPRWNGISRSLARP